MTKEPRSLPNAFELAVEKSLEGGTDDLGETEPLEPIDYSRIHMLRVGCGSIQCPLDAWTVYARDRRASRFFRDRAELGIPIVSDVGRAVFRCPQV